MDAPRLRWTIVPATLLLALASSADAGASTVASDCAGLAPAITAANARPGPDTIDLSSPRTCLVGEPTSQPGGTGPGELPVVTGSLTLEGRGSLLRPARGATDAVLRVLNGEDGNAGELVLTVRGLTVRCATGTGPGGIRGNIATIVLERVSLECGDLDSGGHHGQGRFDVSDSTIPGDLHGGFGTVTRSRTGDVDSNSGYLGTMRIADSDVGDVDGRSAYTTIDDSTVTGGVAGNGPVVTRSTVSGRVVAVGDPEMPGEAGVDLVDSSVGSVDAARISLLRSYARTTRAGQGIFRTLSVVDSTIGDASSGTLFQLDLKNATIAKADLATTGGSVLHSTLPRGGIEGASTVRNSIVGGECPFASTADGPPVLPADRASGNVYPDLRDRSCPGTASIGDPKLGALRDNGGPTPTIALGAGSSAVDLVPASDCPSADQRGVPRPQGAGCDAGAFEQRPARVTVSGAPPVFPGTVVGRTSAPISGRITNDGDLPASGTSLTVTPGFVVTAGSCGRTLAPRSSCTGSVAFRPTVAGPATGRLVLGSDGGTVDVPLRGTGVAAR